MSSRLHLKGCLHKMIPSTSKYQVQRQVASSCAHSLKNMKDSIFHTCNAFTASVDAVNPRLLLEKYVHVHQNKLCVSGHEFDMNKNVYIIGFGKAVLPMSESIEKTFRIGHSYSHLQEGIVSIPVGSKEILALKGETPHSQDSKVLIIEGAKDNLPDTEANSAAELIVKLVKKLSEDDIVITLISGGGSALLPLPLPPLTLQEKLDIIRSLSRKGATISELNTVRKALSAVKGGKLANMTKAHMIVLILSDIMDSCLDVIASGPTVFNTDQPWLPQSIIEKYGLSVPSHVTSLLQAQEANKVEIDMTRIHNIVIGDNKTALAAAQEYFYSLEDKVIPVIMTNILKGDAATVGRSIARLAEFIIQNFKSNEISLPEDLSRDLFIREASSFISSIQKARCNNLPCCFIFGGETTVNVTGSGKGGRNQEMVLAASIQLEESLDELDNFTGSLVFISAGTDGIDGPTDAAGAVTYYGYDGDTFRSQYREAKQSGLDPNAFLENNDSYTYFSTLNEGVYLLKPGHTGTNVMDIQMLYIIPNFRET
ncbi:glycerate kinase [Oratosquilla oratoria]|uniref:glycerate kinase n=1 Tax=Oratosquilla oratoria TaxID=337810 RepID=UPI003F76C218